MLTCCYASNDVLMLTDGSKRGIVLDPVQHVRYTGGVHKRLLMGRAPGCSSTCGAISLSDAFSLALLYLFRNSLVEFHMIIAHTNVGTENSCCERSTGKMLPAVVHIGDRLRRLRDERYLSQRELADKADVSPATVFKLEANRSEPHPRTIRKLAKALGVEPSELAPKE